MTPADAILPATRRYLRAHPAAALGVGLTSQGAHHVQMLQGRGSPPAPDAIFALGSLTQVFTGSLLALMVDQGQVELHTPLSELIPQPLFPDIIAGRITLEQLATHTSGMPRHPPNLSSTDQNLEDPYAHYSAARFGEFLRGYHPRHPPPSAFTESLLGQGVLGHALSRRLRLNYGHAVRDLLCTPLGLGDTTFRPSETQQPRVRPGHTGRGEEVPPWTFPALPGAGALSSTVPDLLRFLDAHLGRGAANLGRALRLTQVPRVRRRGEALGLAWRVTQVKGRTLLWRASVMGGFSGFLGFSPEADTGVVLLSDHAGSRLDTLLGRPPLKAPGFALLLAAASRPERPT